MRWINADGKQEWSVERLLEMVTDLVDIFSWKVFDH